MELAKQCAKKGSNVTILARKIVSMMLCVFHMSVSCIMKLSDFKFDDGSMLFIPYGPVYSRRLKPFSTVNGLNATEKYE